MSFLLKLSLFICLTAVAVYYIKQFANGPKCLSNARIDGKVVLVTGANTGIGKGTVRDLVLRGGHVYMGCRSMERCKAARKDIVEKYGVEEKQMELLLIDLSSFKSVRSAAENFKKKEKKLDILINNAGIMYTSFQKTEDGHQSQFAVNHLGHFLFTMLLLDEVKAAAPSRIINVASLAHKRGTLNLTTVNEEGAYNRFMAYADTKQANILFTRELARHLQGTGVNAYSLHPGVILTELLRNLESDYPIVQTLLTLAEPLMYPFVKDLEFGHQTTLCCAISEEFSQQTGLYYSDCAVKEAEAVATDDKLAKELWDYSIKVTGVKI